MPEWLIEQGIGETRAALIHEGEIVEARIELEGVVPAGSVVLARLTSTGTGKRNAVATSEDGDEYLLPRIPADVTEGAAINVEVVREAIPGDERWKRPIGRITHSPPARPASLAERLGGRILPFPPASTDELANAGWGELMEEARSGLVMFEGGNLSIERTRAMTLIDVDGWLHPEELAVAGAAASARAIRRLDIGGSIGIDLPTVAGKEPRQAAGTAIDVNLPQPFERTAVNGFGFVQIVRPRARASLIEIWSDRAAAEARALLRQAVLESPGAKRLIVHPAVEAILKDRQDWVDGLARQSGGAISLRADPKLPISANHVERA